MLAFKRRDSVQSTEARSGRPTVGVELRTRNPNLSQSNLELSYAYPMVDRPIHMVRSVSSTLPRKPHAKVPLPEIPKEIELRENPSYSGVNSLESLNQPDEGGNVADGANVYDVPVFNPRPSLPLSEYEIPVSSLSSSGAIPTESPHASHMYESTEDI